MPITIPDQLRQLRSRLIRIVLLRGLTLWLLVVMLTFSLLAGLDWTFRFESAPIRWGLSVLFWAVVVASLFRFLVRPLWFPGGHDLKRPSLVEIALWIERSDPRWEGELAAAVSFLTQSARVDGPSRRRGRSRNRESGTSFGATDPLTPVQQSLIDRIQQRLSGEELRHRVSRRHLARWGLVFGMILAAFFASAQAFPDEASLATARLIYLDPDRSWPRRTALELLDADFEPLPTDRPVVIDTPGPVEVVVVDRIGSPPASVQFEIVHVGGERGTEQLSPQRRSGPEGQLQTVFATTVNPGLGKAIRVAAVAEDDRTPRWVTLIRHPPPTLSRFNVSIWPPEYLPAPTEPDGDRGSTRGVSALPQQTGDRRSLSEPVVLENVAGPVKAIFGSRVEVQGTLKLHAAEADVSEGSGQKRRANPPPQGSTAAGRVLRVITDQGREIPVTWTTNEDFEFDLELDDSRQNRIVVDLYASRAAHDVAGTPRGRPLRSLEFTVIEDEPPRVQLVFPDEDQQITPQARLPLRARAVDDFRLASFAAIAKAGDRRFEFPVPDELLSGSEATIQEILMIADWNLSSGDEATLQVVADDHNPRSVPQSSSSVRLRIVSPEEKQRELERILRQFTEELSESHRQQRGIFRQFRELFEQQARAGNIPDRSVLEIRQLAYAQSSVAVQMGDPERGLTHRFERLSGDLEINRLDRTPFAATVRTVTEELGAVVATSLHHAQRNIDALDRQGSRLAGAARGQETPPDELFAATLSAQRQTLSHLEAILELLDNWRSLSGLQEDWDRFVSDFGEMKNETIQLGRETLSRSLSDLTAQQRESLQQLEQQHRRLSERVRQFIHRAAERPPESVPSRRRLPYGQLTQELKRSQVAQLLQSAAQELSRNRIAQAVDLDRQVADALERMLGELRPDEAPSIAEGLELVADAIRWTEQSSDLQRTLSTRIEQAMRLSNPDERSERLEPLLLEQARLTEEATNWGIRLRHAGLNRLPPLMNDVAGEMHRLQQQVLRQQRSAIEPQTKRITTALQRTRDELARAERQLDVAAQSQRLQEILARAEQISDEQETLRDKSEHFIQQLMVLPEQNGTSGSAPGSDSEADHESGTRSASRTDKPRLTTPNRAQRRTLNRLVDTQSNLADDVQELIDETDPFPIVQFALELAQQEMQAAAGLMHASRWTDGVTDHQAEAIRQLREIAAASDQIPSESPEHSPDDPDDDELPSSRHLSELVLLIRLQEQLIQREEQLLEANRIDDDELQRIAEQQQRLTRFIQQFLDSGPAP